MTAHLIIHRRHGCLTWAIDFAEDRVTPLWPAPIAHIPLTEEDLELGGRKLFDRWMRQNLARTTSATPMQSPQPEISVPPPRDQALEPLEIRHGAVIEQREEIHLCPAVQGPLVLPDGRRIDIGDGLVVMTAYRFAQLIEAARFGRQSTDI